METIGEAFVWPARDPQWFTKTLLIGLINLIPIVGQINALGWMLAGVDNLRQGRQVLPPAGFDYLARGWQFAVVYLVYIVVLYGLLAVPVVGFFVLSSAVASSASPLVGTGSFLLGLGTFGLAGLGVILFWLAFGAAVLATEHGGLAGGLDPGRVWWLMTKNLGNTVLVAVMFLITGLLAQLGLLLCFVGIILTSAYAAAVQAWIVRSYEVSFSAPR